MAMKTPTTPIDLKGPAAGAMAPPVTGFLDTQRAAVRALSVLAAGVVEPLERRIDDARQQDIAAADRELARAREQAAAAQRERLERITRRCTDRLRQIDTDFAPVVRAQKQRVADIEAETAAELADRERNAERRREDDLLMQQTVLESTISGLREHFAALSSEINADRKRLDGIARRGQKALEQRGIATTAAEAATDSASAEAAVTAPPATPVDPARQLAAVEAVPILPVVGSVGLWLGLSNVIPILVGSLGFLSQPPALPLFMGGGVGLIFTLVTTVVFTGRLRQRARERLQAATLREYGKLRAALLSARAAVEARQRRAEEQMRLDTVGANERYQRESATSQARFDAQMADAESNRTARIHAAQAKFTQDTSHAQRTYQAAKQAATDEEQRLRSDSQARYAADERAAQQVHADQLAAAQQRFAEQRRALEADWPTQLGHIRRLIELVERLESAPALDWADGVPANWQPPRERTGLLRLGSWQIDFDQLAPAVRAQADFLAGRPSRLTVPALIELPMHGTLLVQADHQGRSAAIATLRTALLRLMTSLPAGRARFTLLDPVALGESFAGFMHLTDHAEALVGGRIWTETEQIEARLSELTAHMETVIQKYLRNEFQTIDEYNAQAGELAEPYRFLVVADFPAKFNDDALRRLRSIMESGARCGVFALLAHDVELPAPPDLHLEELARSGLHLVRRGAAFTQAERLLQAYPVALDTPPGEEPLTHIMHAVGRAAKDSLRVRLPFDAVTPPESEFWSSSAQHEISVPLGNAGAVRIQALRLGRGLAQHVLVAGKTGSGKSNLLHVLVTNIALWYGPDEVELYLVDFKKGVEFKAYATHPIPHIRALAIESDREFGVSVLQRLDAELGRRGDMFRAAGVQDLPAYRQATGKVMPRTLLIVDEFQVFFTEDDRLSQEAAVLLDRLVRQGRAFGIHILLGSQTLGGSTGLPRSTMGQMAVRIALQCSDADSQLILDDTNVAARLLSRPGEAIYNDAGGRIDGNSPFQAAWLPDEVRNRYLDRLGGLSRERCVVAPRPSVFEGSAPADLRQNSLLEALVRAPAWPVESGPQNAPRAWVGESVAIKDPTAAVFSRQAGSNLLLIGQRDDAVDALLCSALLALAAQRSPAQARFVLLDPRAAEAGETSPLVNLATRLPHAVQVIPMREVPGGLAALAELVQQRVAQDTGAATNGAAAEDGREVYVIVAGLQRYRILRKQEDSYSYGRAAEDAPVAPDKHLATLLREGPPHGVHVIAWADTLNTLERTFERGTLGEFGWRVLFQMSANDSSNLIDSPEANRLGLYRALLFSEEHGLLEKFRPYDALEPGWLADATATLSRRDS